MLGQINWRRSSYSDNGANCVEVAFPGKSVAARDSKDPQGAVLVFDRKQWAAFVAGLNR